jgi:hypothetical protein
MEKTYTLSEIKSKYKQFDNQKEYLDFIDFLINN